MDYRFTDPDDTKRAVLRNNIEQTEREYASLEVALAMHTNLAADATLSEDERAANQTHATNIQTRMDILSKQDVDFCAQYDALPAATTTTTDTPVA